MENLSRNLLGLMFGPKAFEIIDAMKEVMTQEEITNFENVSDNRKIEILNRVQEIVNSKHTSSSKK